MMKLNHFDNFCMTIIFAWMNYEQLLSKFFYFQAKRFVLRVKFHVTYFYNTYDYIRKHDAIQACTT